MDAKIETSIHRRQIKMSELNFPGGERLSARIEMENLHEQHGNQQFSNELNTCHFEERSDPASRGTIA
jgi:hypothetical protein